MIPRSKKGAISIKDLVMYVSVFLKHLRLIALLICFSLLLGLFYHNFSKAVYASVTLVHYRTLDRPKTGLDAEKVFKDSRDKVVLRELSSPHMFERVAKRLGVDPSKEEIMKRYLKKVNVKFNAEENLEISVWAYSSFWAKSFGKALVQEYLLSREENRRERSNLIVESFNREMGEIKAKMDEVYNAKFDFRDTNELTQIQIELNELKQVPLELFRIKHKLSLMDGVRETLEKGGLDTIAKLSLLGLDDKNSPVNVGQFIPQNDFGSRIGGASVDNKNESPSVVVLPQMVMSNRPWEDLDKERRRLQSQLDDLGRIYLPGNPKMTLVKKQLEAVERSLELELQVALNRFNLEQANLVEREKIFTEKLPAYNEITRRHQKYLAEYAHFDSGQLVWGKMHDELQKGVEAVEYGDDKERSFLHFVGTDMEDGPVSPNPFKIFCSSVLLSLALAVAIPFLIEFLDNRVSDVDEVEESLRIRGLGVVPKMTDPKGEGLLSLGGDTPDYHLQENFRVIRTNLIINSENSALPQVIIVTSAMPQEGKTVVSSNLAMSFAMKGEKTLLIDGDLRRGRLHRLFGLQNKPGLSDILRGQAPNEDIFRETNHKNLTVMTCGKHMNSAAELLDSSGFAGLMEDLRSKYQRIIIDTPPVLGLAETSIIQHYADGILFVIWSEFTPLRNVKAAIQSLQANGAKFAGFVLNRLDFHALGNRYKYFYYAPNYYTNYKAIEAPVAVES